MDPVRNTFHQLLAYTDSHARSIIAVLIGIITIGSIACGLFVQHLQANIEYKNQILDGQLNVLEIRYRNRVSDINSNLAVLRAQVHFLRSTLPKIAQEVGDVKHQLAALEARDNPIEEEVLDNLNSALGTLKKNAAAMSSAVTQLNDQLKRAASLKAAYPQRYRMDISRAFTSWPLVFAGIIILAAGLWFLKARRGAWK